MAVKSTNIRIDEKLKKESQDLFASLGMDMTTAVNIFLRQAVKEQAIPFRIGEPVPNYGTKEALSEIADMRKHPEKYKSYSDVDEMMKDLLS